MRLDAEQTFREFARTGVTRICDFFTPTEFVRMRGHVECKMRSRAFGSMAGDGQVRGAPCEYADPFAERLLGAKRSPLSELLRLDLVPTYSYLRLYRPGDRLPAHRDRPACEITVSTCLATRTRWPLEILVGGKVVELCPTAPDAVVFRGHELLHWRDTLDEHEPVACLMLHFVRRYGSQESWAYDRRTTDKSRAGRSAACS